MITYETVIKTRLYYTSTTQSTMTSKVELSCLIKPLHSISGKQKWVHFKSLNQLDIFTAPNGIYHIMAEIVKATSLDFQ